MCRAITKAGKRCNGKDWKDGFCWSHHPSSQEKREEGGQHRAKELRAGMDGGVDVQVPAIETQEHLVAWTLRLQELLLSDKINCKKFNALSISNRELRQMLPPRAASDAHDLADASEIEDMSLEEAMKVVESYTER